jgi:hypothetical protein
MLTPALSVIRVINPTNRKTIYSRELRTMRCLRSMAGLLSASKDAYVRNVQRLQRAAGDLASLPTNLSIGRICRSGGTWCFRRISKNSASCIAVRLPIISMLSCGQEDGIATLCCHQRRLFQRNRPRFDLSLCFLRLRPGWAPACRRALRRGPRCPATSGLARGTGRALRGRPGAQRR